MDVLFDYRPALRHRTGVGEYQHELLLALAESPAAGETLHVFSSSWKDRLDPALRDQVAAARMHDVKVPGRLLHLGWHRLGWPPAELLTGTRYDVTHAAHPLRIPSRHAASVVTIHDLDFLDHPEWTAREVRRDYVPFVRPHARAADGIVTSSEHSRSQIVERLGVEPGRVAVCPAGVPRWTRGRRRQGPPGQGHVLFVGTLHPRKNVGGLLDAWALVLERRPDAPILRLAGATADGAAAWLDRLRSAPLAGRVEHLGYVPDAARPGLFERAALVVLPSWHEGFGLPVLEAMALGVPVVASTTGALPELVGEAGLLVDPASPEQIADAILRVLDDSLLAAELARRGEAQSASYQWSRTAGRVRQAYAGALARAKERRGRRD